jgi:hypothetical protein
LLFHVAGYTGKYYICLQNIKTDKSWHDCYVLASEDVENSEKLKK